MTEEYQKGYEQGVKDLAEKLKEVLSQFPKPYLFGFGGIPYRANQKGTNKGGR